MIFIYFFGKLHGWINTWKCPLHQTSPHLRIGQGILTFEQYAWKHQFMLRQPHNELEDKKSIRLKGCRDCSRSIQFYNEFYNWERPLISLVNNGSSHIPSQGSNYPEYTTSSHLCGPSLCLYVFPCSGSLLGPNPLGWV